MDSFVLHERDVPDPDRGDLLVRVQYLSVDPYMRGRMRDRASYTEPWGIGDTLNGADVGEVVESTSEAYEAGNLVTGTGTWADYSQGLAMKTSGRNLRDSLLKSVEDILCSNLVTLTDENALRSGFDCYSNIC